VTGLHPLDGAVYLGQRGDVSGRVYELVAHHSGAETEAEERGLSQQLARFAEPDGVLLDALTFADMTAGPDGATVWADARIAEILDRYDEDDPVFRAVRRSAPKLLVAVGRTLSRLGAVSAQPM